jgi:deoxyadenosine/deoxycytidine kinase
MTSDRPIIGVVGPCAAGKSTLVTALTSLNYPARHIAQEHSYVEDMWSQISNPDILIYLDVSYHVSRARSKAIWPRSIFEKQIQRLEHARNHADLYIQTDDLNPGQVLEQVLSAIGHY